MCLIAHLFFSDALVIQEYLRLHNSTHIWTYYYFFIIIILFVLETIFNIMG